MADNTYSPFYREPSKPHQCVHFSDQDGARCRATAKHGEMKCYHHRPDVILPVLENDPFLLENLDDRAAIQHALGQVAARLACNHMDFERARLLLQTINSAMRNLPAQPRAAAPAPPPPSSPRSTPQTVIPTEAPIHETVILSERSEPKDPEEIHPAPTSRTLSPPTVVSPPTRKPSKSRTQEVEFEFIEYPPMKRLSEYPPDECEYLTHALSSLITHNEITDIRPASLSHQEAEDFINAYHQKNGWDPITLPPDPEPTPDDTPATLPNLQATAETSDPVFPNPCSLFPVL